MRTGHHPELWLACLHAGPSTRRIGARVARCDSAGVCGTDHRPDGARALLAARVGATVGPPPRPRLRDCSGGRIPWRVTRGARTVPPRRQLGMAECGPRARRWFLVHQRVQGRRVNRRVLDCWASEWSAQRARLRVRRAGEARDRHPNVMGRATHLVHDGRRRRRHLARAAHPDSTPFPLRACGRRPR